MKEEQEAWLKKPVLSKMDLWVLKFSPRAIIHGLRGCGLKMKEQLAILVAILKKYGKTMDDTRRKYLEGQVKALRERCT